MNADGTSRTPTLAIVFDTLAPYRPHLLRRLGAEMGDVRCVVAFTAANAAEVVAWEIDSRAECVGFAPGRGRWTSGGPIRRHLAAVLVSQRMIRWLRDTRPDLVVVNGYNDVTRVRTLAWCRRHRVPAVLRGDSNIRCDTARGLRRWFKSLLVRWCLRQARWVAPMGRLGEQYFLSYGAPAHSMRIIPLEPEYELFQSLSASEVQQTLQHFGLDSGRRRLLLVGRLEPVKRPDLLIRAFAALMDDYQEWDLIIVGEGSLRKKLATSVSDPLRARLHFLGGLADRRRLAAILRGCDVLVIPSDYEPWAVVVNEAAAAGLAIIASDVVGAAFDLVRDGVNGFTFPAGDLHALRSRLAQVMSPGRVDELKQATLPILTEWRRLHDPVRTLRELLYEARPGASPLKKGD